MLVAFVLAFLFTFGILGLIGGIAVIAGAGAGDRIIEQHREGTDGL